MRRGRLTVGELVRELYKWPLDAVVTIAERQTLAPAVGVELSEVDPRTGRVAEVFIVEREGDGKIL